MYGPERVGSVMGLVSLALIPGSLGGPPILGISFDNTGSYLTGIIASAVIVFIAFLLMLPLPKKGEF